MLSELSEYCKLLDRYDLLISEPSPQWADGRREKLVAEMDKLWDRLTVAEQEEVGRYQWTLYLRRTK